MSVQVNVQHGDSSTRAQTRQLSQPERHFSAMLDRMRAGGDPPDAGEIEQASDLAEILTELRDSLEMDGTPGLEKALQTYQRKNHNLNLLMGAIQAEKEQAKADEENPNIRIDARGKRVFRVMTEEDVDQLPDIEWTISGILMARTVSLVFGDSNVGKTFFALQVARSIARGQPWYERDVKAGPVLYIYAEGRYGLKPRLRALRKHYGESIGKNLHFIAYPVHLIHDRTTLLDTLTSLEAERGEQYALVVIDTISNCANGINQNDQTEVFRLLDTAHEIVRTHDTHVLVVHHTNKQGGANGSAALKNHVDTQVELKKASDDSPVIICHCEKQRDAERFKDILFELKPIELGVNEKTLEPITSCVMVESQSKLPTVEKAEQEGAAMLAILKENPNISKTRWEKLCKEQEAISARTFEARYQYMLTRKMFIGAPAPGEKEEGKRYNLRVPDSIEDILNNGNGNNED